MSEGAFNVGASRSPPSASPSPAHSSRSAAPAPAPYRDYASDRPSPSDRLSDGEIMGWYHAHVATESAGLALGGIRGLNSFPGRLYRMLSHPEYGSVIRWMEHGRAWKVLHPHAFADHVLPKFNGITKYSNFVRQANAWGFRRVGKGRDEGCYYHEMFLRGRPDLVGRMRRPKEPKTGSGGGGGSNRGRRRAGSDASPDFYAMPWLPLEEGHANAGTMRVPSPVESAGSAHRPPQAQDALPRGPANPEAMLPHNINTAAQVQGLQGAMAASVEQHLQQAQLQQQQFQQLQQLQATGDQHPLTLNINSTINLNFGGNAPCQNATGNNSCQKIATGSQGVASQQHQQLPRYVGASFAAAPSSVSCKNQWKEPGSGSRTPLAPAASVKLEDDGSDEDSFVDPFEDDEEDCDDDGNNAQAAAKVPEKAESSPPLPLEPAGRSAGSLTPPMAAAPQMARENFAAAAGATAVAPMMQFPPQLTIATPNIKAQRKPGISWEALRKLCRETLSKRGS